MEIVLIVVGIIIVALQVLQFMDRRKQEPSATPLATDPTAPVYVADDVKNIVRDSLDAALVRLGEQARVDREEAIKLSSQQVAKDSSEQLGQKADSISQTLTTIKDAMEKKIGELDKELRDLRENNRSQFDNVGKAVDTLSRRTENLNEVLSNSQKRGQWGERLAEDMLRAAGFVDGVNYTKQDINAAGGKPDFKFNMPPNRVLYMDVKFPLDQYSAHFNAETDALRASSKTEFVKAVKGHVDALAKRDYVMNSKEEALDYVLMFVPNESISGFVHEADPTLIDYALSKKVVLCSPLTLYAFLVVIRQATDSFHTEQTAATIMQQINKFSKEWVNYAKAVDQVQATFTKLQGEIESIGSEGTRYKKLNVPVKDIEKLRKNQGIPELTEAESSAVIDSDDDEKS
jgi:DNA recombination protein RmuC